MSERSLPANLLAIRIMGALDRYGSGYGSMLAIVLDQAGHRSKMDVMLRRMRKQGLVERRGGRPYHYFLTDTGLARLNDVRDAVRSRLPQAEEPSAPSPSASSPQPS